MNRLYPRRIVCAFLLAVCYGTLAQTQVDDAACLECHGNADLWDLPAQAALLIASETLSQSAHGGLSCVDCHSGIEELPHADSLTRVNCAACHEDAGEVYARSVHGKSLADGGPGEGADCAACHGTHDIFPASDVRSRVHHRNLARTCVQCHEDHALVERHRLGGEERIQSYVLSVHGQSNIEDAESNAATCNNCHGWHDIQPHTSPESRVSRERVAETCGQCHSDVVDEYLQSVHGELARQGNPDTAVCTDCHGEHTIRSPDDRQSTVSRMRIAETCGRCHEDQRIVDKYKIPISLPATTYSRSVHGKALLSGENDEAAACHDCHGHHSIRGGDDPASKVNRKQIPETCGGCHQHAEIREAYEKSIHGTAMRRGVREAPVCTDCHGEHTILHHLDPDSPVYPTRLAKEVCGRCHDSLVVNRKYGLPTQQVATYFESYHGLASRLGDTTVANCASCHGVHDILPAAHPDSWVNPNNLLKTCGHCHPGASPQFVAGLVHVSHTEHDSWIIPLIRKIYIWIIILTIGGMLLHNLLIMFRHVRDKYRQQQQIPHVIRFPRVAIAQHLLLTVSFVLLVITGFSLKFPESLFSSLASQYLGLTEATRGLVHRIAGVILILTGLFHVGCMIFSRQARADLKAILLRPRDLRDVVQNVGYHLGLTNRKPRFGRYDYSEKMEYWALIWGTTIMVLTGLLMWFPAVAGQFGLSRLWVDVARVIHYYEAWLATLAIIVWHFFFVIFHPEEYPMALSWLTGKLPVSSMEERHPEELEELLARGEVIYPAGGGLPRHSGAPESSTP